MWRNLFFETYRAVVFNKVVLDYNVEQGGFFQTLMYSFMFLKNNFPPGIPTTSIWRMRVRRFSDSSPLMEMVHPSCGASCISARY